MLWRTLSKGGDLHCNDCESDFLDKWYAYWLRLLFPRLFILYVWYSARVQPKTGFKYMWFHTKQIRDIVLFNPNVKKILLTRRNVLRAEVSRQIAVRTKMWARIEEPSQCNCIQFDLEEFWLHYKPIRQQIVDLKRTLEAKGQTYLEIFYEELVGSERECVLERLCDFLEVKRSSFDLEAVIFKRQNPFALSEIVTNYDEVKKALAGTEAEWMVKDG